MGKLVYFFFLSFFGLPVNFSFSFHYVEAYLEPCQTLKMECSAKRASAVCSLWLLQWIFHLFHLRIIDS